MKIERLIVEKDDYKKETGAAVDRFRLTVLLSEPAYWYAGHVAAVGPDEAPWIVVHESLPSFVLDLLAVLEAHLNQGEERPGFLVALLEEVAGAMRLTSADCWCKDDSYTLHDYLDDILDYEDSEF